MRDGWEHEVAELNFAKQHQEALALVREAIKEGNMAAHVMLAKMGDEAGLSRDEANRLIDYAEAKMNPDDAQAHWQLYRVYDLGLLGTIPYEEKPVRAFMHLRKAGELGFGGMVPLVLARLYRFAHRAAAIDADEVEAVRWYKRAIEQGSAEAATEAVAELQEFSKELEKRKGAGASIHRLSPVTRTES